MIWWRRARIVRRSRAVILGPAPGIDGGTPASRGGYPKRIRRDMRRARHTPDIFDRGHYRFRQARGKGTASEVFRRVAPRSDNVREGTHETPWVPVRAGTVQREDIIRDSDWMRPPDDGSPTIEADPRIHILVPSGGGDGRGFWPRWDYYRDHRPVLYGHAHEPVPRGGFAFDAGAAERDRRGQHWIHGRDRAGAVSGMSRKEGEKISWCGTSRRR